MELHAASPGKESFALCVGCKPRGLSPAPRRAPGTQHKRGQEELLPSGGSTSLSAGNAALPAGLPARLCASQPPAPLLLGKAAAGTKPERPR